MKKLLVIPLIMSCLLFSCSTTEEVPQPVFEDPVVETVNVEASMPQAEPEEAIEEPILKNPAPDAEEVPLKELPAVEEKTEDVTPVIEVEVKKEPEKKDTVLTGKALVEHISEEEKNRKASSAVPEKSIADVPSPVESIPEEIASFIEEPSPVEQDIEDEVSSVPVPDAPLLEAEEAAVTETPEKEDSSVLDTRVDSKVLSAAIEIISILVIFALSSVIRNKYSRPLSIGLSFLLAILFTAIPMLIAFILSGWSNIHLLYIVLIFTVFIFASRRGH